VEDKTPTRALHDEIRVPLAADLESKACEALA
jgi:hypothetical protein